MAIYAQYYQGQYQAGSLLGYGIVTVGAQFIALDSSFGVIGTLYNVTAVTPGPNSNGNVLSAYPGDTVTLDGGIGVLPATSLAVTYLAAPGP